MSTLAHIPVLLNEAVEGLVIKPNGVYVDATFGRGGHSAELLSRLSDEGRLYALDQDLAAIDVANQRFANESRFDISHASFSDLEAWAADKGLLGKVDGLLLDIGVSSPQLDEAQRGFSFSHDGPLDMRMNQSVGQSAAQWLATAEQDEIANVIYLYGEERQSRRIARRIIETREETPIERTYQLADIVASVVRSKDRNKHPATRTFQAIRIHVNQELDALKAALTAALSLLAPTGRLAVISFHSLEDRIVKQFMRDQSSEVDTKLMDGMPRGMPLTADIKKEKTLILCGKMIKASEAELVSNPRARSAVLRVAERTEASHV